MDISGSIGNIPHTQRVRLEGNRKNILTMLSLKSSKIVAACFASTGAIVGITKYSHPTALTKLSHRTFCDSNSNSSIISNSNRYKEKIVLYQYKICPYCNRVKAYLDYMNIDYEVVEVDPLLKTELKFSKEYKKVPIVMFDDTIVNDSTLIIDRITNDSIKYNLMNKTNSFLSTDSDYWSQWSDKRLSVMLYPNITRNLIESLECFSYTSTVSAWSIPHQLLIKYVGAAFMLIANDKIKKKYNIIDERAELKAVLTEWVKALDGKEYLHGNFITLPDILVFGVLRSIDITSTFRDIMSDNPELRSWYNRVSKSMPIKKVV